MWKSFFLAFGIFLIVLGLETLVIDNFVMAEGRRFPRMVNGTEYQAVPARHASYQLPRREIRTKDWMPWSLLAGGIITVMYTCSIHNHRGTPVG